MKFSVEEILLIIGLAGGIFAFITTKVMALAKDLATLKKSYETLEASKFSLDERMDRIEKGITDKFHAIRDEIIPIRDKVQELDRNTAMNGVKLDTVISGIKKIFEILDRKADKVAV